MGAKPKDIVNKKYGRLTAIRRLEKKDGNCYIWLCRCDCGNEIEVSINRLEHGDIKSCGCLIYQHDDITGKKFGYLTALSYKNSANGRTYWNCKCDCGNQCVVAYPDLVGGNTKSCGCLKTEILQNMYVGNTNIPKLYNKKLRSTNTSGTTGVSWDKNREKWAVEIIFQGARYRLGRYDKKEEAISIRKLAEDKLHGDFLEWYENEYKASKNES